MSRLSITEQYLLTSYLAFPTYRALLVKLSYLTKVFLSFVIGKLCEFRHKSYTAAESYIL